MVLLGLGTETQPYFFPKSFQFHGMGGLQKRRLPTFRPGDWAKKAWQRSNTHDL